MDNDPEERLQHHAPSHCHGHLILQSNCGRDTWAIYQAHTGMLRWVAKPWGTQLQHFAGTRSPELRSHHTVVFSPSQLEAT